MGQAPKLSRRCPSPAILAGGTTRKRRQLRCPGLCPAVCPAAKPAFPRLSAALSRLSSRSVSRSYPFRMRAYRCPPPWMGQRDSPSRQWIEALPAPPSTRPRAPWSASATRGFWTTRLLGDIADAHVVVCHSTRAPCPRRPGHASPIRRPRAQPRTPWRHHHKSLGSSRSEPRTGRPGPAGNRRDVSGRSRPVQHILPPACSALRPALASVVNEYDRPARSPLLQSPSSVSAARGLGFVLPAEPPAMSRYYQRR